MGGFWWAFGLEIVNPIWQHWSWTPWLVGSGVFDWGWSWNLQDVSSPGAGLETSAIDQWFSKLSIKYSSTAHFVYFPTPTSGLAVSTNELMSWIRCDRWGRHTKCAGLGVLQNRNPWRRHKQTKNVAKTLWVQRVFIWVSCQRRPLSTDAAFGSPQCWLIKPLPPSTSAFGNSGKGKFREKKSALLSMYGWMLKACRTAEKTSTMRTEMANAWQPYWKTLRRRVKRAASKLFHFCLTLYGFFLSLIWTDRDNKAKLEFTGDCFPRKDNPWRFKRGGH